VGLITAHGRTFVQRARFTTTVDALNVRIFFRETGTPVHTGMDAEEKSRILSNNG